MSDDNAIATDDKNYMRVIFYNDANINNSDKISFSHGIIDPSKLIINGKNPMLARLEATTSMSIQYDNKPSIVYNNPYSDRYVIIRLDGLTPERGNLRSTITSCSVNAYIPSLDHDEPINQSSLSRYINIFLIGVVVLIIIILLTSDKNKEQQ